MAFTIVSKSKLAIFDGAAQTLPGVNKIKKIAWTGMDAAHTLTLTSGTSTVAEISAQANNDYIKIEHLTGAWVDDLTTTALGGGKLYVLFE